MNARERFAGMRRGPGFTLIELLVVVGIIALLISILLPSMAKAREQAKSVKCLANLKEIGKAMVMYFGDNKDWFPFEKSNTVGYLTGFYYGGHPGRAGYWGYDNTAFRTTPAERPFNRYLYTDLPDRDYSVRQALYESIREMPIYLCPSDTGGFWNNSSGEDSWSTKPMYYWTGTSYDLNYHFVVSWAMQWVTNEQPPRWLHRANAYLRQQQMYQHNAARFIILYEDPFDSSQWLHIPRRGWHKGWNRHNFLFLDAHAAATVTDTLNGATSGRGWKSASGNQRNDRFSWWWNRFDPDYGYRNILPLYGW
jgi:prepilin-type N-terminal cleavage/methylation domain-containing protein